MRNILLDIHDDFVFELIVINQSYYEELFVALIMFTCLSSQVIEQIVDLSSFQLINTYENKVL